MARIYAFPWWTTNPYLNMLYIEARARGWRVDGRWRYEELLEDLGRLEPGDVVHLHWTSPVALNVKDGGEYRSRIARLDVALEQATTRGVQLFWTVHNAIAHDTKFRDEEILLAKVLASRATRIIVINSKTQDVVSGMYSLPEHKIRRVRHASYWGVYEESPGKRAARAKIGIPPGELVIGLVGGIRPYKGVGDLLRAARLLAARNPRVSVLLAGGTEPEAMAEIEAAMPDNVTVYRKHARLSDEEVVTWTAACDVFALPYARILNSGSMLLAATLGVPCVVPAEPHLVADYGGEAWVEFFEADGDATVESLAKAIEACADPKGGSRRRSARAFAEAYTMHDMAVSFADLLPRS